MKQSVDDHEFVITDVHAEDAGEYECSGENAMIDTVIKQTFTLSVQCKLNSSFFPLNVSIGGALIKFRFQSKVVVKNML